MAEVRTEVRVSPRAVVVLHRCLATLSATFLAGTLVLLHRFAERGYDLQLHPLVLQLLAQSNLSVENVLAAWYSSMLLLSTAVVCTVCFLAERRPRPASVLRFGWIGLAAVFAALSWDELGSLHEREVLPSGTLGWLLWLVPFIVAVPVYMLLFAWFRLRRSTRALTYVCLGVLLLATVPLQEFVEVEVMLAHAAPGWRRPVLLVVLEEGTELLGMQLLLAGVIRHALDVLGERRGERVALTVTFPGRGVTSALYVAVVGLVLAGTYELGRLVPPDPANGRPENWPPSVLAFVASVTALSLVDRVSREREERLSGALLAALSLLTGAYVGGVVVYDAVRGALAGGILLTVAVVLSSVRSRAVRLGSAAWAVSALVAVTVPDLVATRLSSSVAAACLILGLCAGARRAPTPAHRAARRTRGAGPALRTGVRVRSVVPVNSAGRRPWPRP